MREMDALMIKGEKSGNVRKKWLLHGDILSHTMIPGNVRFSSSRVLSLASEGACCPAPPAKGRCGYSRPIAEEDGDKSFGILSNQQRMFQFSFKPRPKFGRYFS